MLCILNRKFLLGLIIDANLIRQYFESGSQLNNYVGGGNDEFSREKYFLIKM